MRAVLAANPGLGVGPGWIDKVVQEIAELDFSSFCASTNPDFQLELKALFILAAKAGGGREFWIADELPKLMAFALCHHEIRWGEGMTALTDSANLFVQKMRTDLSFWQNYPLFTSAVVQAPVTGTEVIAGLASLPVLSRIHLFSLVDRGSTGLMRCTTYPMRSLGINEAESAPVVLASGLCEATSAVDGLAQVLSKDNVIAALAQRNIPYRKSWKKGQLLAALAERAPEIVSEIAQREKTARIAPQAESPLRALFAYATTGLQHNIKLLCFVGKRS